MLIALAGLPGSGKSTLAVRLAKELGGVVLDKDIVRSALFPGVVLDYSAAENEIAMSAIYRAAGYIRTTFPRRPVLIDGRTYLRAAQLRDLLALGASLGEKPRLIECVCAEEVAIKRLEHDLTQGRHPARDRNVALYRAVKARAEPLQEPRLVLDTGRMSLEECVAQSLRYLGGGG